MVINDMSLFKISLMTQFRHVACRETIKEIVGIQAAYVKDFQAAQMWKRFISIWNHVVVSRRKFDKSCCGEPNLKRDC